MTDLVDALIAELLPRLEEAARASHEQAHSYVEPRQGLLAQASARRDQFIVGRRGVGKTRLLLETALLYGGVAIYIDVDELRGLSATDKYLTIANRLLLGIASEVRMWDDSLCWGKPYPDREGYFTRLTISAKLRYRMQYRRAAKAILSSATAVKSLLESPEELTHTVGDSVRVTTGRRGALRLEGKGPSNHAVVAVEGNRVRESTAEKRTEGQTTQHKVGVAHSLTPGARDAISIALKALGGGPAYLLLDDFSHVPTDEQPELLQMLHQLTKTIDVHMKIAANRNRLVTYVDRDPPVGMQIGHDAGEVDLDISLERFDYARSFLEDILAAICEEVGVSSRDLLSEGARDQLVLLSGAIPRDYLYLVTLALRHASESPGVNAQGDRVREPNVSYAYERLADGKRRDLSALTQGQSGSLERRFSDIVRFCIDQGFHMILIDQEDLKFREWGHEVERLSELRLLHPAGSVGMNVERRFGSFAAFVVDLPPETTVDLSAVKLEIGRGFGQEVALHVYRPTQSDGSGGLSQ